MINNLVNKVEQQAEQLVCDRENNKEAASSLHQVYLSLTHSFADVHIQ